jgi:hypothetical protein
MWDIQQRANVESKPVHAAHQGAWTMSYKNWNLWIHWWIIYVLWYEYKYSEIVFYLCMYVNV